MHEKLERLHYYWNNYELYITNILNTLTLRLKKITETIYGISGGTYS